jgi:ATP-dependent helicase/nuclease subunit B
VNVFFGLQFDSEVFPNGPALQGNVRYTGPNGLLILLESFLGLSGHPADIEYLRIEEYRQVVRHFLQQQPDAFFRTSFEADQFATATDLLHRRDELLLAGWNFQTGADVPPRLQCIAQLEQLLHTHDDFHLSPGPADRYIAVFQALEHYRHPIRSIRHNEPLELLPFHWQRLFEKLRQTGTHIEPISHSFANADNDLGLVRKQLQQSDAGRQKQSLKADGSLLILRSPTSNTAALYLAQLLRHNPDYRPVALIPERNRTLDNALVMEGQPSLGIQSASTARPSLQILKLVPAFLWKPIDPYKILEFVTLALKPLDHELGQVIANQLARTPGIQSAAWNRMIHNYFEYSARKNIEAVKEEYEFWFEHQKYAVDQTVPKEEVFKRYRYVQEWAYQKFEENESRNASLLVLSDQAKKITEILQALPEQELTNLELERIVRTIYEPAPVVFQEKEVGHLPFVYHSSAFSGPFSDLIWWNFFQNEPVHFFSRWYQTERNFLAQHHIQLESPQEANARLVWQRKRPLLLASKSALLVIPATVEGSATHPHPLFSDLEAGFDNLETITFDTGDLASLRQLSAFFSCPDVQAMQARTLGRPEPFVTIEKPERLFRRDYETYTSLNNLFYYPYQWVFKYQIRLRKSPILSVAEGETLMGNLAHRAFELLLQEPILDWDKSTAEAWIDEHVPGLLAREGAVLLMYGFEPEKVAFIQQLKYAAWSLIKLIQDNGWNVAAIEAEVEGQLANDPIKGIADLVLVRGQEKALIDLKWRGASRRSRMIKNEEDLQLILYARMLSDAGQWAHTAYFIINKGQLIARNNEAFDNIVTVDPDGDRLEINQRIWNRMKQTYAWRLEQIRNGKIEIRCERTYPDLEFLYQEEAIDLYELLEMRDSDAPYDDYRTLIGLLE